MIPCLFAGMPQLQIGKYAIIGFLNINIAQDMERIALVWNYVTPLLVFLLFLPESAEVRPQENLTVMSYNVRYDEALFSAGNPKETDWVYRKEAQVALIDFHSPDVVGMQEPHLHQVCFFAEKLPDYAWVGVGREDGKDDGEYNPIFYRKDKFRLLDSGTFWLSETPEKPSKSWDAGYLRICTWTKFETKDEQTVFFVFNTHFDSKGQEAREWSAALVNRKIRELAAGYPAIVMGDLNFTSDNPAYSTMKADGLQDSRVVSISAAYGPEGTFNGFQFGQTPKNRIDYIFVGGLIKVLKHGVLTDSFRQNYPSDHLPVMVAIEIEN